MNAKIIIAGSRSFSDYELLKRICSTYIDLFIPVQYEIEIISGTAKGADRLGERFAREMKYKLSCFPADWNAYGKRAGYLRNEQMAKYAKEGDKAFVILFWDGQSAGTKHMWNIATKHKLQPYVYNYKEER